MIIVLDTSAAMEILLHKGKSGSYEKMLTEAESVIAPELHISEITKVAWKYHKIANFKHEECYELAEDGITLVDQFMSAKAQCQLLLTL